jgi:Electron transfer DM13
MVALLVAGMFALDRWVAETMAAATLLNVAWFALVGGGFLLWARSRSETRPVLGTLAAVAAVGAFVFYWTGVRDETVDEDVVTASRVAGAAEAEAALAGGGGAEAKDARPDAKPSGPVTLTTGMFTGVDGHDGSGEAAVVEEGGDRTLTFTDFDVDPGAQVEVWLTPGPDEIDDRIELGGLKGNVGDQQYEVPADADLNRYGTVVLYCTPFTVRIAVAPLEPA